MNGLLSEICDGNVTRIARGGTRIAQAIASADGQRTTLGYDAAGRLSRISNPAKESVTVARESNGFLTRVTSLRRFSSTFEYDLNGLLMRDRNAAQGQGRPSSRPTKAARRRQVLHRSKLTSVNPAP